MFNGSANATLETQYGNIITRDNIFAIDIVTKKMSGRNMTLIALNDFGFSTQTIKVKNDKWHNINVDIVCQQLCRSEFWFTSNIVNAFGNIYYTPMEGEFFWNLPNFGETVKTSINKNKVCYSYLTNNKIEAFNHNFPFLIVTFISVSYTHLTLPTIYSV